MDIPVIDFADCGLLEANDNDVKEEALFEAGTRLYKALSGIGVAYITNSGIPSGIIEEMDALSDAFFSLPLEEKMKFVTQDLFTTRYDPDGSLRVSKERPHDKVEGLRMVAVTKNRWPDIPGLEKQSVYFQLLCKRLTLRLLKALGRGMKLEDKDLFSNSHRHMDDDGYKAILKFSHYPAITEINDPRQLRIAEHKDFGSFTLLFLNKEAEGLQIQSLNGEYEDIKIAPNSVLLMLGEQMEFWTSGRLRAVYHRVVFPDSEAQRLKIRRTMGYFAKVDDDIILDVLEGGDTKKIHENEKPITAGRFWRNCFDKSFL